ncbi:MAG: hypothetical protein ACFNXY_07895 [Corynebacterium matruchotii]|uniref:hypothetical protein n=1 Tax=Corynebacterium matruchotii TaxID=43768 RepID=UPI00360D3F36
MRKENLNFIKVFMWPIALFSLRRLSALFLERITSIMPVHFDWRSLQQYALPALGIVSLLVSAIIAVAGGLGLGGSSSDKGSADANVIFKVVDQHGMPRVCQVIQTGDLQLDRIYFNKADGTLPVKAEPGTTVTRIFSCDRNEDGEKNTVEVSAVAPETGVLEQKVVVPNPNAPSANTQSSLLDDSDKDVNVVFKVVDQHGLPRLCHVKPTGALHTDNIVRTSQLGTYGVKAEPGSTVTRIFDCKPSEPGTQVVEASAIAPQGDRKILQEVVIPDPNSPSASFSS